MSSYYVQQDCPICGAPMILRDATGLKEYIVCDGTCDLRVDLEVAEERNFDLEPRMFIKDPQDDDPKGSHPDRTNREIE